MKRVLVVVPLLAVVLVVALVVSRGGGSPDGSVADTSLTADVVPYPRTTSPLPVPEVRIADGPWRDDVGVPAAPVQPRVCQVPRFAPAPRDVPRTPLECRGD